jgi:hypothetical protein
MIFNGRKTFEMASDFLQHDCNEKTFWSDRGYALKQTLLNSKAVSRAECVVDENGFLRSISERDFISAPEGIYFLEEGEETFSFAGNNCVDELLGYCIPHFSILHKKCFLTSNYMQAPQMSSPAGCNSKNDSAN